MAYQIAFDLEENATQDFLLRVATELPQPQTPLKEEGAEESEVGLCEDHSVR